MPAGMNFIQLEGNYVVSFRDTSECLPAFTAVRLDRRRSSLDSGIGISSGSTGNLEVGGGGGDASPRRKRSASSTGHKFVITGIPAKVRTETIKSRLEDTIPGIVRVYRDPDMARELAQPPVFVETRLSYALDSFMLHPSWVPVVQRLVKESALPRIEVEDEMGSVRFDIPEEKTENKPDTKKDTKAERRKSLVALAVTCPHGKYLAQETCFACRHQDRRFSYVADNVVTHPATPKRKPTCPGMCLFSVFRGRATPMSPVEEQPPTVFLAPNLLASVKEQRRHSAYDIPVHNIPAAVGTKL